MCFWMLGQSSKGASGERDDGFRLLKSRITEKNLQTNLPIIKAEGEGFFIRSSSMKDWMLRAYREFRSF